MFFRQFALVLFGLMLASEGAWADTSEPFDHPEQFDSTGFFDGFGTTYRITTTGFVGSSVDLVVASWAEGTSSSAGILLDAGNKHASFSTDSAVGFTANEFVLLGIADVPGFGDAPSGGPFGSFFSTAQNLSNAFGSADIRQFTANPTGGSARFLAIDQADKEVWTDTFPLATGLSFTNYGFSSGDFTNGDFGFDDSQVVGIGIEFFGQANASGTISNFQFDVDNLQLNAIPEPNSFLLLGTALLLGVCLHRREKK